MSGPAARLFVGRVFHGRHRPLRHAFGYRVFSVLLDIDRLDEAARRSCLFAINRFGVLSFHERDHGARDGSPLRPWVEAQVANAGIGIPRGQRIEILCFPRLWSFVFNPLSIYFIGDGEIPAAIVYEVKNTFGEQHAYALSVDGENGLIEQETAKTFHVSPFMQMGLRYRFRLRRPDDALAVAIDAGDGDGPVLTARLTGRERAFDDRNLAAAVLGHPLMTLKVVAAIHWQALRLWLKGAPFFRKPAVAEDLRP
ncbi:DUF1365 domain-containing protein [Zavarzinia aquatilis]|uniref:DUF1365 domain-containing protein n=1 Tax=Zavarzinia aquatilis TaxID=2211142 RepID=A0A317DW28_9PROT|nr:DUF1365 domain-containing protein [Zavarzinia aquatilis]PWR18564.1 DUF1365 domain-containing protein [Zavarzinia aquatilis]